MQIGIDARWITPEISGIGRYTERLIQALAKIDSKNHYFLFFSNQEIKDRFSKLCSDHSNFEPVDFHHAPFSLKGQWLLPQEIKRLQLDLFHSTNFMLPLLASKVKLVCTIHDLIPFLYPHYTPKAKKTRFYLLYYLLMRFIAKRADLIFADSEHSRSDIIKGLKVKPEKVKTVYMGIEESYLPSSNNKLPEALKNKIQTSYFLYVGRHDPYKNILRLVQAYAEYLKKVPFGAQLVITGKRDSRYPEAYEWCQKNHLLGKVIFTDYISDEELLVLYQKALTVVLVSQYEGFGLPPAEAMACGVPVICSNVASLPEVTGEAALLVHPDSVEEISEALVRLYCDELLQKKLSQQGIRQVKKFSWQHCAQQTLAAYHQLDVRV